MLDLGHATRRHPRAQIVGPWKVVNTRVIWLTVGCVLGDSNAFSLTARLLTLSMWSGQLIYSWSQNKWLCSLLFMSLSESNIHAHGTFRLRSR